MLYSWKFWNWKFIKPRCNGSRRSTFAGNGALLPSDVIDCAMLPAQRFWRETVSLLDVMWFRRKQWEHALLGKNFQPFNNHGYSIFRGGIRSFNKAVMNIVLTHGVCYILYSLFLVQRYLSVLQKATWRNPPSSTWTCQICRCHRHKTALLGNWPSALPPCLLSVQ